MSETELEQLIAGLVARKNATEVDSAEWRFYERQLAGIRYSGPEAAGGIIEDLDPYWGSYCRPL